MGYLRQTGMMPKGDHNDRFNVHMLGGIVGTGRTVGEAYRAACAERERLS